MSQIVVEIYTSCISIIHLWHIASNTANTKRPCISGKFFLVNYAPCWPQMQLKQTLPV